jgi:hypothetical protein
MRTELPEEISRVSDAMTEAEEILRYVSVNSSERPLSELAQGGYDRLSTARKKLDELSKELRGPN